MDGDGRTVSGWPPAATSAPSCARRSEGPPRGSRRSSGCTGRAPTAPRISSCTTPAAAEDIAQESFLAAVRNLDRFDRRRPFGPWLHRIVVNRAIDWTRARTLRGEAELRRRRRGARAAGLARRSLLAALAALPPEHRAVIVLRHLLEYTPGEIAELLGLPRGTVNSRLRRGLDSLKETRVKRELEQIEIPDEHEARERSLAVVRAAFAEREPQPPRRSLEAASRRSRSSLVVVARRC